MKKTSKTLVFLLLVCMSLSLVACKGGAQSGPTTGNSNDRDNVDYGNGSTDNGNVNNGNTDNGNASATTAASSVNSEPMIYPACAEWSELNVNDQAIQFEDFVLYPGQTIQEVLDNIDSSADKALSYELVPTRMVDRGYEDFCVKRNDTAWIWIKYANISDEIASAKDCIVVQVYLENEAVPYCRFFDGSLSYDDIIGLPYAELSTITKFFEEDFDNQSYGFNYQYISTVEYLEKCKWTGYAVKEVYTYYFCVNQDTGLVESFDVSASSPAAGIPHEPAPESLRDLPNAAEIEEDVIKIFSEEHPDYTVSEIIGYAYITRTQHGWFEDVQYQDVVYYL